MNYSDIINICFILYVKITKHGKLVFPAVDKSQGKEWNYIIIVDDPLFNGVYRYKANLTSEFRIWTNNGKPCYKVPFDILEKIKELDDLDPNTSLGRFLLKVIDKMRTKNG